MHEQGKFCKVALIFETQVAIQSDSQTNTFPTLKNLQSIFMMAKISTIQEEIRLTSNRKFLTGDFWWFETLKFLVFKGRSFAGLKFEGLKFLGMAFWSSEGVKSWTLIFF